MVNVQFVVKTSLLVQVNFINKIFLLFTLALLPTDAF